MNPWTTLASALRALPTSVRRTLYSLVTAAGAVLAIAQIAGLKTIGPVDLDQALAAYALLSSPTGVLALANVRPREHGDVGGYPADRYDDTYDESYDAGGYDDEYADRSDDLVTSGAAFGSMTGDEDSFS